MTVSRTLGFHLLILTLSAGAQGRVLSRVLPSKPANVFTAALVNDVALTPLLTPASKPGPAVLRAQILLDRAHFSPGEIDGRYGGNTRFAVAAFNRSRRIRAGSQVTAETWKALNADAAPAIIPYAITVADAAGPFAPIPTETADKAKLTALGYTSPAEELGEGFHVSAALLRTLNPGVTLDKAGTVIQVPNVTRSPLAKAPGMSIHVSKRTTTVEVLDPSGALVASYPATMGSVHDPLPIGKWKINGVEWNPTFNYNPDLFWDAEASEKKAKLPPGPNNPVGVVWIDLSKPHYGIHGTPEPSTIGKTTSHGCVRLTNWDAAELAKLVTPGMPAILEK